jgi:hypothetical protein
LRDFSRPEVYIDSAGFIPGYGCFPPAFDANFSATQKALMNQGSATFPPATKERWVGKLRVES